MLGMKYKSLGKQMRGRALFTNSHRVGLQERITYSLFFLPATYRSLVQGTQVDGDGKTIIWDLCGLKPSPNGTDPTTWNLLSVLKPNLNLHLPKIKIRN